MSEPHRGRAKALRWLTLLSGLIEGLFVTGIACGWTSLVFVLKNDGYFANTTTEESNVHTDFSDQDEHFSWVMSVATIANTLLRFPIGYFFDHCGTIVTRLIGISLYFTGTLLITLSNAETSMLLYPAQVCLSVAGTILYITNVQVGNLFDSYRSTIITIYNGAFDSSAVIFLIIKLLHERGVSLRSSFLFLTLCSIIHLFRTFFLMPRGHIPYLVPETYTYGVSCPGQSRRGQEEGDKKEERVEEDKEKNTNEARAEDEKPSLWLLKKSEHEDKKQEEASFQSCVLSWLFLWHLVWVATIHICNCIFLATINPMLTRLADNDQTLVSHYTNAFAFTQLCAVLVAPVNGLIMDRNKHKTLAPGETKREADLRSLCLALFLTSLQCFLFRVCSTCPVLPLQYLTFILQVVTSSFFYGGHQVFLCIAFPTSHFGKLTGVVMSLSALALLLQFPILHLIQHQLHGDQFYVNVGVTLVSLFSFIHPIHVHFYCKNLAAQRRTKQEVNEQGLTKC